jgi:magnesium transporter
VLAVFAIVAERFLAHLDEIDGRVNALEERLQQSLDNREVMRLLHLQRSLMMFATSLDLNEDVLATVRDQLIGDATEDVEVLEDALVELRQAKHVAATSSNMLSEMMDAFASIISNNLSVVVKLLSAMAVVLVVPTIIGTFYGMNVKLPLQEHPVAFWIIVATSTALSVFAAVWFWRRRWL